MAASVGLAAVCRRLTPTTPWRPCAPPPMPRTRPTKHPVTPGQLAPARELYGAMLLNAGHGAGGARRVRGDARRRNRAGSAPRSVRPGQPQGVSDGAKARRYYAAAVALAENADPVRPEIAEARTFMANN